MNEENDMLQSMVVEAEPQNQNNSDEAVSPPSALSKEEDQEETGAIDDLLHF